MKTYNTEFKSKMLSYINEIPGNIVLRSDLKGLGDPRRISRNIKCLLNEGKLIKLGYSIYAKTEINPYLSKPIVKDGFTQASLEALDRLGIEWEPGKLAKKYNTGKSTQVPANLIVRLKTRYRGIITDGKRTLKFEDNINAV